MTNMASRQRIPLPTYAFARQRYWVAPPHLEYGKPGASQHEVTLQPASNLAHLDLASPEINGTSDNPEPPMSEYEELIAEIWQDALGIFPLSNHANLLELGVDSLLMTQVLNRLRETFAFDIPILWIFEAPTIALFARRVEDELTRLLAHEVQESELKSGNVL
jgi:aryl carrier-like protein